MISYELAKKLREAGFKSKEGAYIPTLEELIEICGDKIEIIGKHNNDWYVQGIMGCMETGNTLDEAVANFYLELHKKE